MRRHCGRRLVLKGGTASPVWDRLEVVWINRPTQRIGINIKAKANLCVVRIATYWWIPRHAFVCIPPPPRKNQTSAMSFSAASHTTYSIIGISLSRDICLQEEGEGSEIQKLLRDPSIGRCSDDVKVFIATTLKRYRWWFITFSGVVSIFKPNYKVLPVSKECRLLDWNVTKGFPLHFRK